MKDLRKVIGMRSLAYIVLTAVLLLGLTGCFEDDYDPNQLRFENASTYSVMVYSLTTEWGGFPLDPGMDVVLEDIQNVDYRFEPSDLVQEGSASTTRDVVFVNAPPSEAPAGP